MSQERKFAKYLLDGWDGETKLEWNSDSDYATPKYVNTEIEHLFEHEGWIVEPSEVTFEFKEGFSKRTHEDGWTIAGTVKKVHLYWVNYFAAVHSQLGAVWGDFSGEVRATSKEAYDSFLLNHAPKLFDYDDVSWSWDQQGNDK